MIGLFVAQWRSSWRTQARLLHTSSALLGRRRPNRNALQEIVLREAVPALGARGAIVQVTGEKRNGDKWCQEEMVSKKEDDEA